jgi:hypothetical protein
MMALTTVIIMGSRLQKEKLVCIPLPADQNTLNLHLVGKGEG